MADMFSVDLFRSFR